MAERRLTAGAAAAALILLAGCSGGGTPGDGPGRDGRGPTMTSAPAVRTDPEPLTKRFAKLGAFSDPHWQGSAVGQDTGGVPGPTDVRILALVRLAPADLTAAGNGYRWEKAPDGWESAVSAELRPFLPSGGQWRTSREYATEVLTAKYAGDVYLHDGSGTVFLTAVGG